MVTALPGSPTHQIPFTETPHGRLAPSSGRRVLRSISRTPIAHLVNARSPPPARFHAPFTQHTHAVGRVMPSRHVSGLSNGLPSECAVTAQIAHRKYAIQYAGLVRIRVRTGSRFALRFATTYARTWCEPSQRLPRWLPRKVTNASSCQALVSTVVSRVLQWFPLATRSIAEQSQGGGATSLQALHKSRRARRINMRK